LIHDNGPRRAAPFVEINCAALPENLLESELFGAQPGAHSTATQRMVGKVSAAQGGTLFLDEIALLPTTAQAKLLQLLQTKEFYPLGAARAVRADVRVIAATNTDLKSAIAARTFREDLYYRLQVLPLHVPSLAERKEDIPELARHFCERARLRHGLRAVELSPGALRGLSSHAWPGNVRQLEHVVEASVIRAVAQGAERVELSHVFPEHAGVELAAQDELTFQEATRRFQSALLEEVLSEHDWNVSAAARRLDLTRAHVYNLIKAFNLSRKVLPE
jgi:Nif-specific regulatory protein